MSSSSDEILTGEGVALQVQTASVIARAGGWLIDAMLTFGVYLGLVAAFAYVGGPGLDEAMVFAIVMGTMAVLFLVVPITVETLTHGLSLGKLVVGVRIIRDDGGPVRLRHATTRALVGFFELWMMLGSLAFVVSMLNNHGKRVGDYLAGTYAASMRGARSMILPIAMPPELIGWVSNADLRPLPDALALQARQFLQRAHQFPPHVRHRLGLRVAAQLERYVAPSPPTNYPERFIAAVLCERRLRDQRAALAAEPRLASQLAGIEALPYQIPDPAN